MPVQIDSATSAKSKTPTYPQMSKFSPASTHNEHGVGLIEVGQASPFGVGGVDAPIEAPELGGDELVVGGRCLGGDAGLAGREHLGSGQELGDLVEHEGVELVGAYAPLPAGPLGAAGAHRVSMGQA
jgi:hypothetical protein